MRKFLVVLGLAMLGANAHAGIISDTSWDGAGKDLQSLFNGWVGPGYDVNANYLTPGYWSIGAVGMASAVMVIEIAGNAGSNTFGLFDRANSGNRLEVYNGVADAGDHRSILYTPGTNTFTVLNWESMSTKTATFSGSVFGFYLDGPGGTFFSDSALNGGNASQMVAFQGQDQLATFGYGGDWLKNEWVLAWEDLPYGSSDKDFNDLVLLMESVKPVPEPGTISLFGAGLVGLAMIRRRKRALA